ncbi:lipoate--protein ligase family protein [Geopsychrobacter electrodiphilus]|uniref:lipoate--protein ligase family protein n=1 Tax=Geopsychrobacter electrodiphilus TaxID=225196 RepID=UPI00039B64D1|nr:protein ligase [Geopsychrobacter electrodiphilus]
MREEFSFFKYSARMKKPPVTELFPLVHFDRPWQLLRPAAITDPVASIRFDDDLLQRVGSGELGPSLCIRQGPQSLAVTKRESRMPNFALAAETLALQGWPLVVRSSGGSCVPQGPGIINLSLIHPRLKNWTLEDGYRLVCHLLEGLLATYGLHAETGEVPGSFCDGRYNLQVGGQKLVGTAQRWAGSNREQAAILVHACLLVDLDLDAATSQINHLYRMCSNPLQFDPAACTSLRQCLENPAFVSPDVFITEVEERLARLLLESFAI